MKSNFRKGAGAALAFAAAMFSGFSASADVKLSIPDFTVSNYKDVPVEIVLDNSIPIQAYSFNIELPAGLEIVQGSVEKTDRFNQGQTLNFRNNVFGCISMQQYDFFGDSGAVGTFKVRYTGTLPAAETQVEIKLTNIQIVAQNFADNVKIKEQTTTVTLIDNTDPAVLTLSSDPQSFLINPGGVQEVAVAIDNNKPIQGMQMNIVLPDGFSFETYGGNIFEQTARMSGGATITPKTSGNTTRVVIADMMNNLVLSEGSGDFMKFKVIAPADFTDATASIEINDVQASVDFRTVKINDTVSIALTNGLTAYNKAMEEIEGLENSLTAALTEIATSCPDVKDQFTGTEVTDQIEALKNAVTEAYENRTLTGNYVSIMAPVSEIESAIARLITDAKAAQKAHEEEVAAEAARQEAYANANAVVADLEKQLSDALQTIATDCPDVKDNYTGKDVSAQIAALKKDIQNAYDNKTIATDYDNVIAPKSGIESDIAQLISDAKAAQQKHNEEVAAEAARQQAYANANAVVADLEKQLSDALQTIATDCPDVKDNYTGKDVSAQIAALKKDIQNAYDNKTIATNYDNVIAPKSGIESDIAQLISDAKASQKAFEENAALETARLKANAEISELDKALADALAEIAKECPDVKGQFTGADIQQRITVLRNAVNNAVADKTLVDKYDEVMAPAAGIESSIAQLVIDAKAAQKKADDDAAAAQALLEAYAKATTVISELNKSLSETVAVIAETCPDVKDRFTGNDIEKRIANLKEDVKVAYDTKTLVDKYGEVMAPVAGIEASIDMLLKDAQNAQKIVDDEAAASKALEEAYNKANATIAELDKSLADALVEISKECPDVKHLFSGSDIQQQIIVLRNAINNAYADKTLTANYDDVMAPVAGIESAIAKLVEDAKNAQKKVDDEAAAQKQLSEAYDKANDRIKELRDKLSEALSTIAETCPDVKKDFKGEEIDKSIDTLKEAVKEAFDNKTLVENYDEVLAPAIDIESAIEKLIEEAQEAQKAIDDAEAARQEANKEAYEADLALINDLRDRLNDAIEKIRQDYPGYAYTSEANKITDAIDREKDQADTEYERVSDEGRYSNKVGVTTIENMIDDMLKEAERTSGIITINGEDLSDQDRIFSIDGKELPCAQPGKVNIIIKADGRRIKAYVK